jgi:origin recognition complex subunit 6
MAGVESILCLPPPPTSTTITDGPILQGKTPALIAAVWFFVVIKMRGKVQQGKETSQRKKLARESLDRARSDPVLLAKVGEDEESWRGWQTVDEKDVNLWRKEIVGKGWREMDWFENVQEGVGVGIGNENSDSEQEIESLDGIETSGEKIHRTGQGKAVLDKYDYLSAAKQNEYQEWKKGLLAKVHGLIEQVVLDEEGDVVMD